MQSKRKLIWLALVACAMLVIGVSVPLVYEFNDDVMMRSILSGVYTGTPDGHAVYMMYPLTGILSMLYRCNSSLPWLTWLLTACIYLMIALIGSTLTKQKNRWRKQIAIWLLLLAIVGVLILPHFILLHYTVVAAMLAATAVFYFLAASVTTVKRCIVFSLLLFLCYQIRSQVFWMSLPFVMLGLLWYVIIEKKAWKEIILALLVTGIMVITGSSIHSLMYSSESWKSFLAYNAARTQLYDYQEVLPYEDYQEEYENAGLSAAVCQIYAQYDILLAEDIGEQILQDLSEFYETYSHQLSFTERIGHAWTEYSYRSTHGMDFPYNYFLIGLYLIMVVLILYQKGNNKWLQLGWLASLGVGRTTIWLYLIYQGRYPKRVTDSLYLIEIFLLLAIMIQSVIRMKLLDGKRNLLILPIVAICLIPIATIGVRNAISSAKELEKANQTWTTFQEYCQGRENNHYFVDVYSIVPFTAGQYEENYQENYMLLGGWMTNSELQLRKLQDWNVVSVPMALLSGNDYYLAANANRDLGWLDDYMKNINEDCEMICVDQVVQGETVFNIYSFVVDEK